MSDRCPTGIPGLDEILGGGFPRARSILLAGSCGTGKTTLAIQFLVSGIVNYNEPGVLVTLEQDSDEIRRDMLKYGWDLKKLEEEKKLILIDTSLSKIGIKEYVTSLPVAPEKSFSLLPGEFDFERITDLVVASARKINAKRVVVDSLPALDVLSKNETSIRRVLLQMNYEFKVNGLNSILITEVPEEDGVSKHGVEEYVSDGVIIVKTNEALDTRTIKIRKMRITKHTLKPIALEITQQGIQVKK
ncbi:MAG: ATPase [Candidatus Altiarchaeales archaeon]|nr:ATPase [Candidatus Altiarchaeales archaeon]